MTNIEVMNAYKVKKIVTTCPHCFNTLKNEYPDLGGKYDVIHHTQLLRDLLDDGRMTIAEGTFKGKRITYHDPCYLGRANNIYEAPRELIQKLDAELVEMKSCKSRGLCCGAGGAQMFKEPEAGKKTSILSEPNKRSKPNRISSQLDALFATPCYQMVSKTKKKKTVSLF